MNISLSKEQLKDLIFLVELGRFVRERSSDVPDTELDRLWAEVLQPLLVAARAAEVDGIAENRDGKLVIAKEILSATDEAVAEYDDETFWFELESRLGERDFYYYGNDKEIEMAEKTGKLPDRVEWYYRKYRKEFDEHGVDRLEISEEF
ncbi:MAG: hypothetical protein HGB37_04955 [Candidatus Moranbacteria bacterium]|nr:hypothetical protein [Candidatus Moranbacteria bacterium]